MHNEFFVAVQALLENYLDAGNSIDYVLEALESAKEEWLEEDHPEYYEDVEDSTVSEI